MELSGIVVRLNALSLLEKGLFCNHCLTPWGKKGVGTRAWWTLSGACDLSLFVLVLCVSPLCLLLRSAEEVTL